MNLGRSIIAGMILLMMSAVGQLLAQSQPGEPVPSLGELARQLRAARAKVAQKPAKVFTNDNLPARPAAAGLTVAAQMSPTESGEAQPQVAAAPSDTESAEVHDEKYYRRRMAELRSRREIHQRELSVLQQKLSQNQMQYYPDPNRTLLQEYSRADINKLMQDIEKKKQEIDADEQAVSDLQDQLRREGAPPGWLR